MTDGEVRQIIGALEQGFKDLSGHVERLDQKFDAYASGNRSLWGAHAEVHSLHAIIHAEEKAARNTRESLRREGFTVSWRLVSLFVAFLGAVAGAAAAGNGIAEAVLR